MVYVHMCVQAHMPKHAGKQRPEEDIWCLALFTPFLIPSRQGLVLNLCLDWCSVSPSDPVSATPTPPSSTGVRGTHIAAMPGC